MINYELIGTHPQVERYADSLPTAISMYEKTRSRSAKQVLGETIVLAAEHFYGLSIQETKSMRELIAAVKATDNALAVR